MSTSRVIQNHSEEAALLKRRAVFLFACIIILLGVLVGNLYRLQVVQFNDYEVRSNNNRTRIRPIAPNRGLIYDRNGVLIAENRPFFSLELIPEQVENKTEAIAKLRKDLNFSPEKEQEIVKSLKTHTGFQPATILTQLSEEDVAKFSVLQYKYPGIRVHAGLKRYYPFKHDLTHMLGYVGSINSTDKAQLEKDNKTAQYAATKDIGKRGIERFYENILHGKPGRIQEEVNNHGRLIQVLNENPPISGLNLHLTIDINVQRKAVKLLEGKRGSVVAIEPNTGEILAMVSSPSYDPNLFVHGVPTSIYKSLTQSADKPLINRASQGQYAPASTIKPHLVLAGLNYRIISESTKVWDPGWWQMPGINRRFRDWRKWGHGWVGLNNAVAKSCDVYFYDLAYKMGIDKISEFMHKMGFGQATGIDINEEYLGILPSRAWKKNRYKQPWYLGDTISIGIGQGYWTATPLQLAQSVTILATKGRRIQPHLLKATSDDKGKRTALEYPEKGTIELNKKRYWDVVARSMHKTANWVGGSGYKSFGNAPYKSAVKSGTAQLFGLAEDAEYDSDKVSEHLRDNALFVGWAPYKDPKIVIAVVIENAGWGSSNGGPVVRKLFDEYLLRGKTR